MSERLVAWLHEQVNEDERVAKAAGNRRWLVQDNTIELWPEREGDGFMSWPTRADARHAANWDPARVLAEVEFKRKLLADYENSVTWSMDTLRDLASTVYKDRPGYTEAMSGE